MDKSLHFVNTPSSLGEGGLFLQPTTFIHFNATLLEIMRDAFDCICKKFYILHRPEMAKMKNPKKNFTAAYLRRVINVMYSIVEVFSITNFFLSSTHALQKNIILAKALRERAHCDVMKGRKKRGCEINRNERLKVAV